MTGRRAGILVTLAAVDADQTIGRRCWRLWLRESMGGGCGSVNVVGGELREAHAIKVELLRKQSSNFTGVVGGPPLALCGGGTLTWGVALSAAKKNKK